MSLLRRKRPIYPTELPSYLLPPVARPAIFDPSLRRAGEVAAGRHVFDDPVERSELEEAAAAAFSAHDTVPALLTLRIEDHLELLS